MVSLWNACHCLLAFSFTYALDFRGKNSLAFSAYVQIFRLTPANLAR